MTSPSASQRNSPADEACMSDDSRSKSPLFDSFPSECNQKKDNLDDNNEKKVEVGSSWTAEKLHQNRSAISETSGDIKPNVSTEANTTAECDKHISSLCIDSKVAAGSSLEMNERSVERDKSSSSPSSGASKGNDGELNKKSQERRAIPGGGGSLQEEANDTKLCDNDTSMTEDNLCKAPTSMDDQKRLGEGLSSNSSFEGDRKSSGTTCAGVNPCVATMNCGVMEKLEKEEMVPASSSRDLIAHKVCGAEDTKNDNVNQSERQIADQGGGTPVPDAKALGNADSTFTDKKEHNEGNVEAQDIRLQYSGGSLSQKEIAGIASLELEKHMDSRESKFCSALLDKTSDPVPTIVETSMAAAAKGPFVPPEELLRFKGEIGWKGSAATSAFRPAEPRKVLDMPLGSLAVSHSEASSSKHNRPLLDFDLNVPDERVFEEIRDSVAVLGSMSNHTSNYGLKKEASDSPSVRSSGVVLSRGRSLMEAGIMIASGTSRLHGNRMQNCCYLADFWSCSKMDIG
nr:mucin-19-like isoform X3 [Ipomoea batatas]